MLKLKYTRKTYYSSPQSTLDAETVKERYSLSTVSDAIRLALKLTAESPAAQLPKKKSKTG
jgi:hypothetical protein